jgi:hypothetical protein
MDTQQPTIPPEQAPVVPPIVVEEKPRKTINLLLPLLAIFSILFFSMGAYAYVTSNKATKETQVTFNPSPTPITNVVTDESPAVPILSPTPNTSVSPTASPVVQKKKVVVSPTPVL